MSKVDQSSLRIREVPPFTVTKKSYKNGKLSVPIHVASLICNLSFNQCPATFPTTDSRKLMDECIHYEGGIKSNANNYVKGQLKVGLHFCLSKTFKVLPFTDTQRFNILIHSLKAFSKSFSGKPLRRSNMAIPNF